MPDFLQLAGSYCSNTFIFIGGFKIITVCSSSRRDKTHFMLISSGKMSSARAVRENSLFGEEPFQTRNPSMTGFMELTEQRNEFGLCPFTATC